MCYQDGRGHETSDPLARGDDHHYARIDPAQEIARARHSLSLIESYLFPQKAPPPPRRTSDPTLLTPKTEVVEPEVNEKNASAPGMLGSSQQGGLYAGPTSAATHLLMQTETRESEDSDRQSSQDRVSEDFPQMTQEYDRDLLALLPSLDIIDGLIKHYFEYCNWIYRHVNQASFTHQWEKYKSGAKADRIVLATACAMMSIATHYLPARHPYLEGFLESPEELGTKFFSVSTTSLQRHTADTRKYTLELVELMLCRAHFLTLAKTETEELWHARGELITIGMAMGLHRDPGRFKMSRDLAERRRWAWWHIVLLERWQAFMFGRPIAVASHHFDTQLPSYCDPAVDKTGRLYVSNIALFRLSFILGNIMDDAVSVRPVPYENILAHDRALVQWMENLPPELDLDEYRVARSLASTNVATRRLGVQSVIIRTSYYHIRFTLHRPYAASGTGGALLSANGKASSSSSTPSGSAAAKDVLAGDPSGPAKAAQSLEIAVSAADKLITMVGQSRPDFMANSSLAVPGHMNWGPFHCFSAAMFFSFQLIANPDQAGAGLFRESIRKALATLDQGRGSAVADKSWDILTALAPLYSSEFPMMSAEVREKKRVQVLGTVRKLAFPYHDSHDLRRFGSGSADSPSGVRGMSSPSAGSSSVSPPLSQMAVLPGMHHHHHSTSSSGHHQHHQNGHYDSIESHMRAGSGSSGSTTGTNTTPGTLYSTPTDHQAMAGPGHSSHSMGLTQSPHAHSQTQLSSVSVPGSVGVVSPGGSIPSNSAAAYPHSYSPTTHMSGGSGSGNVYDPRYYIQPVEESIWGAQIGFGQGEWTQFLDGLRPEVSQGGRHSMQS
ncbi:fungal-specific transcription factor domain-containing protein [Crepidotus variabilis]|uniref:Fungal-specific transcription factor domain-containing protein n=1 Tax=Crepidotus variabilis TaxID=179855 RepID=A0A9P6JWE8_9AGAR|nr:fungal-specific transcription factor domain-containing protein [Crepidotus variabilis]